MEIFANIWIYFLYVELYPDWPNHSPEKRPNNQRTQRGFLNAQKHGDRHNDFMPAILSMVLCSAGKRLAVSIVEARHSPTAVFGGRCCLMSIFSEISPNFVDLSAYSKTFWYYKSRSGDRFGYYGYLVVKWGKNLENAFSSYLRCTFVVHSYDVADGYFRPSAAGPASVIRPIAAMAADSFEPCRQSFSFLLFNFLALYFFHFE